MLENDFGQKLWAGGSALVVWCILYEGNQAPLCQIQSSRFSQGLALAIARRSEPVLAESDGKIKEQYSRMVGKSR